MVKNGFNLIWKKGLIQNDDANIMYRVLQKFLKHVLGSNKYWISFWELYRCRRMRGE